MAINKNRAVLFDLDGVLIDSPDIHAASWVEIFRPYGIELPLRRLHLDEGRKSMDIARGIVRDYKLDIDDATLIELIEEKREIYRSNAPVEMRRDAKRAVIALKRDGWLMAIVSGSVRANVMAVLKTDELKLFDALVLGGDYKHGKPHPEPFQVAADKLNVEPAKCVVIENGQLGVKSAKSAGMKVIAVTTTLSAEDLRDADYLLEDLESLPDIIDNV